jgi:hypothetical protein
MKLMKRMSVCLSLLALCVVLTPADRSLGRVGDQKGDEPASSQAGQQNKQRPTPDRKYVVLGSLESRDKVVTIIQGPKGIVYTIKTKDGKTVAKELKEKDLQAKYPGIYRQIKSGLADDDATLMMMRFKPRVP